MLLRSVSGWVVKAAKACLFDGIGVRKPQARRRRITTWRSSEELEARLLLTDPAIAAAVTSAQQKVQGLSNAALVFGTEADAVGSGWGTGMTNFGTSLGSYSSSLQGLLDINQTITDVQTQSAMQTFSSIVSSKMSGVSFGGQLGQVFVSPNNLDFSIMGGAISGGGKMDGSSSTLMSNLFTANSEFRATVQHGASGDTADVFYKLTENLADTFDEVTFIGQIDAGGRKISLVITHYDATGYFKINASEDTHSSMAYKLLQFEGGFETEDAEMDFNYSKSTNYMNPNGTETWSLHSQANLGTTGYFSFDTQKNSTGTASQLYLVNQNATTSGGILARVQNGDLAVGVAAAVMDAAQQWEVKLTGYTTLGPQPTVTVGGLNARPTDLGRAIITGVNLTGNFTLQRRFYLINIRPAATATFQQNVRPKLGMEVGVDIFPQF